MDNNSQRTFRLNEYSLRYSEATNGADLTLADEWRANDETNKQSTSNLLSGEWTTQQRKVMGDQLLDWYGEGASITVGTHLSELEKHSNRTARETYEQMLELGAAREQARKVLPLSTYTEMYVNADLNNLLKFLKSRLDAHAQKEIRDLAEQLHKLVALWCPIAHQAWNDYERLALKLTASEIMVVSSFGGNLADILKASSEMTNEQRAAWLTGFGLVSKSERIDFIHKLKRLVS